MLVKSSAFPPSHKSATLSFKSCTLLKWIGGNPLMRASSSDGVIGNIREDDASSEQGVLGFVAEA